MSLCYSDYGNAIVETVFVGINLDKVDISVEGHHLRIASDREEKKETQDHDYYANEIRREGFERILHLPAAVDREKTCAEIHEGVLKITLAKKTKEIERH